MSQRITVFLSTCNIVWEFSPAFLSSSFITQCYYLSRYLFIYSQPYNPHFSISEHFRCERTAFSSSSHSGHFVPPFPYLLLSISKSNSTSLLSFATDSMCLCPHRCSLNDVVIAYLHTWRLRNKITS